MAQQFSFYDDANRRDLHSFPTRRSSDLAGSAENVSEASRPAERLLRLDPGSRHPLAGSRLHRGRPSVQHQRARSEEHTSELQSQSNLVCRLLLEKKNTHPVIDEDGRSKE